MKVTGIPLLDSAEQGHMVDREVNLSYHAGQGHKEDMEVNLCYPVVP